MHLWGEAVRNQNKAQVVEQYEKGATLVPTMSNEVRQGHKEIGAYFDGFLPKIDGNVEWTENVCKSLSPTQKLWTGTYRFSLVSGPQDARFTFVLTKDLSDDDWKITHHHSSAFPEDKGNSTA